ncbi:MAG: nuclear transport factor 2 family protein [Desulfurellaceae bacterium]|nr:nuclear transport factor 2 family protein [Desulfurellaceae bacterium]
MAQDEIVERNVFKVRVFIDAWRAIDPDVAMACLSDDIVYINQPLEPVVGQQNVRKIVAGIMQLSHRVHWELRNCFGRGNTVVTEITHPGAGTAARAWYSEGAQLDDADRRAGPRPWAGCRGRGGAYPQWSWRSASH